MLQSVFKSDTPNDPRPVDGFTLLHAAYGLLAAWVLELLLNDAAIVMLIIAAVAGVWEIIENRYPGFFGPFFGESEYEGDSMVNAAVDVIVGIVFGLLGLLMGSPANYISGFVFLGVGVAWAVRRWRSTRKTATFTAV